MNVFWDRLRAMAMGEQGLAGRQRDMRLLSDASIRLGVERVRYQLHMKGLLTPEIESVIQGVKNKT